jgi:putative PEP-CTERM system TPR-repeat lipoprotein
MTFRSERCRQLGQLRQVAAALGGAAFLLGMPALANDDPTAPAASVDTGRLAQFLRDAQHALDRGDTNLALIQLKNAARTAPANTEVRVKLGLLELQLGDATSAERELRQAQADGADPKLFLAGLLSAMLADGRAADLLKEFPDPPAGATEATAADVLRARAVALQQTGKSGDATAAMERSLALRRDVPNLIAAAALAEQQQAAAQAEKLADEAIALDPASLQAVLLKLDLRRQAGDQAQARVLADRAVELDVHGIRGKLARIVVLFEQNENAKALEDVTTILAVAPKQPQAIYYKALLLARNKDAKGAWALAQSLPPDYVGARPQTTIGVAIIALENGNLESAGGLLSSLIAKSPTLVQPRTLLASIRLRQDNAQEALNVLEPIKDAGNPQALALLAQASLKLRQFDKATGYLEKASAAAPDNQLLKTELAVTELQAGKEDEGLGHLRELADRDPTRPETAVLLIATLTREGKYDQALGAIDRMDVKGPLPSLYRGQVQAARGDLAAAATSYEAALASDAGFTPARFALAQVLTQKGDTTAAHNELEKVLQADPKNVRALLSEAELAAREDKADEVNSLLQKAAAAAPSDVGPLLALANYQITQGHYADAQKTAENLLRLSPDLPDGLMLLGRVQSLVGDKQAAVTTYRRMQANAPQSVQTQYGLAGALAANGDQGGAVAALDHAVELDPHFLPARESLIKMKLAAGETEAALKLVHDYQAKNPGPTADLLTAATLASTKQADEAGRLLQASLEKHPDSRIVVALSQLALRANDQPKARRLLADWLTAHADDTAIRQAYATLLLQAGDEKAAAAEYQTILTAHAYDAVSLNNLGWLLQKDDPQRAMSLVAQAAKIAPRSADVIDTLGWMKYQAGDHPGGLTLLTRAHNLAGNNGEISYHLAVAMDGTGNRADAKKLLEAVLTDKAAFADSEAAKGLMAQWK